MAQALSSASLSNSAARGDMIREAVQWIAEREAEAKAINDEIREYKSRHIKGTLGFKLSDWNAVYRVSQLDAPDRDALLDVLREGFAALGIGDTLDWVAAAEATPRGGNGAYAEPDPEARAAGRQDGLGGVMDHADRYLPGEPGHADYWLGRADGEAERARALGMGDGAEAPRRGRGRPRKQQQGEDGGAAA